MEITFLEFINMYTHTVIMIIDYPIETLFYQRLLEMETVSTGACPFIFMDTKMNTVQLGRTSSCICPVGVASLRRKMKKGRVVTVD